jgi:hypothetical protein
LLFLLIASGIWLYRLLKPVPVGFYQGENQMALFWPVFNFLNEIPYALEISGFLMFILAAFLVQRISFEFGFYKSKTLLPGTLFLLIAGGLNQFTELHPVSFALFFLLIAISQLFGLFDQRKPYGQLFNANLLLGIGSLFYLNLLTLLPAFIIAGKILGRETRWREPVISVMGALLPWLFTLSIYYLADNQIVLLDIVARNIFTPNNRIAGNLIFMVYAGFLLFITVLGSMNIILKYDENKVSIRQYYLVFFLLFVSSIFSLFLIPAVSTDVLMLSAVPLTFLITNLLLSSNKNLWGELVIYTLATAIVLLQMF